MSVFTCHGNKKPCGTSELRQPPVREVRQMPDSQSSNESTVLAFFSALSDGDLKKVAEYMHPDASWTTMITGVPGAGRHEGRDRILGEFIGPVRGTFKPGDPKVHVDTLVSSGDTVMAECRAIGERADGREYRNFYAWAFELRDRKIAHVREYMDSLYVAKFFDLDLTADGS
ncbi:nuclear transport factor 2 family protein [Tsuneonella sp. HG222]